MMQTNSISDSVRQYGEAFTRAADILADVTNRDGLIHLFAVHPRCAHLPDAVFFRGGALANLNPVYDPALDFAHGAWRSALCQNLTGLARCILDYYENIAPGEALILLADSPSNALFTEAVSWAANAGLSCIAIVPADAELKEALLLSPCGASETEDVKLQGCAQTLAKLLASAAGKAQNPPLWSGDNLPDESDPNNAALIERYLSRVKHL